MTVMTPEPIDPSAEVEREFTIKARTQGQMVRGRFIRHRGAIIGFSVLIFVILLAYTSIGFWIVPGWWDLNYRTTGTLINEGAPTLDLIPWIDGDGFAIGPHPFGQDTIGRDYFALTMRGTQISLMVAFVIGFVSTFIGVVAGAISGYYGGKSDQVIMRFTDLLLTIPLLIVAAVVGASGEQARPPLPGGDARAADLDLVGPPGAW